MFNPMVDMFKELRSMNKDLIDRLDTLIDLLGKLIVETKSNRVDFYEDGK